METVLFELVERGRDVATRAGRGTLAAVGRQVLDTVACVASGGSHPLATRWVPLLPRGGDAVSLAAGGDLDLVTAVAADATLSHVDEFDPLHAAAAVAPGAVVVPAALA
ncbi:MAG: hypothetical protein GEV28_25735, partial [Actinophytocola sp.]|uniref:hypothetical protein n=1 Tax=Actinophytocola sp. TaxID=1872138 RepID=UPI0013209649